MANVLSYFTFNVPSEDKLNYEYYIDNKNICIYYKKTIIFSIVYDYLDNLIGIRNHLTNMSKDVSGIIANSNYIKNYADRFYIFSLYSSGYCDKLKYWYSFINKIRYIYKILFYANPGFIPLYIKKYFQNNFIYVYIMINKNTIKRKYTNSYVLIPNKYEMHYYSNYLHFYT
jgi:hypothetical protein